MTEFRLLAIRDPDEPPPSVTEDHGPAIEFEAHGHLQSKGRAGVDALL